MVRVKMTPRSLTAITPGKPWWGRKTIRLSRMLWNFWRVLCGAPNKLNWMTLSGTCITILPWHINLAVGLVKSWRNLRKNPWNNENYGPSPWKPPNKKNINKTRRLGDLSWASPTVKPPVSQPPGQSIPWLSSARRRLLRKESINFSCAKMGYFHPGSILKCFRKKNICCRIWNTSFYRKKASP